MALSPAPHGELPLTLERGDLRVEILFAPFALTVRRGGRRLIREATVWAAEGTAADQFIQLTEGVIAHEQLGVPEAAVTAEAVDAGEHSVTLRLGLSGGRQATLRLALPEPERLELEFDPAPGALRLACEWDTRDGERFSGLGVRHHIRVDHAGRSVQLGADRRYTGPDCPADLLAEGGIPQADCAPVPYVCSSRGWSAWIDGAGNGTRFVLGEERIEISARAVAGPLRLHLLTAPTPAARLRALCRLTGWPDVLPEWGYGVWKSRDVYEHQDDVLDDFEGFRRHAIPLDAVVIDSPWETQYNTWEFNPHQFPDAAGMIERMRAAGVRTVVWVTPWVNLDSRDGQIPPQPGSLALHLEAAANYAEGAREGHFVLGADGEPFVTRWWMGDGSPIDFTSPAAEEWWREQAKRVLRLGVQGIKADDGEGYYFPDDVRFADGRRGGEVAWEVGRGYRRSMQRALDEVHPGEGVLFGRSGWSTQHATGVLWAGDQASDFYSLRVLVAATLSAASSAISNFSHDVGGYLGHRLVERCPPELMARWVQFGCFTPLFQAHGRMEQEPWTYGEEIVEIYRAYTLVHEQLVPYIRAAAASARRSGLPIVRPLSLTDPRDARGWTLSDAYGFGPALWVAPVLDDGAREREVILPRGRWIEAWSGREADGGGEHVVPAPLHAMPLWVRSGAIVVTHPAEHVSGGLGDVPETERPLQATLWGEPALGHAAVRLACGTVIRWRRGRWSVEGERDVSFAER